MDDINVWLATSLERLFPKSPAGKRQSLTLNAARGERMSFQVGVRSGEMRKERQVHLTLQGPLPTRIRRVGYVPMAHVHTQGVAGEIDGLKFLPGLVPDPLFDEDAIVLGSGETHAFWCNVQIPRDAKTGFHRFIATLTSDGQPAIELRISVRANKVQLEPRHDFPVVQWFYADALCDHYQVQPFSEDFWTIVEPYMRNLTEHFQDCIYVPIFTPPLDGVKRPTQLLKVAKTGIDRYSFDWSDVKRWTDLSRKAGITYFEWTHFFTQWGVENAIRIYERSGGENPDESHLLWPPDTKATSTTYRAFLNQFMPEFKSFLERERLLDTSFFHVSDEPHKEHLGNYLKARELLRDTAPWMKTMDALTSIEFGRERITDLPIPSIETTPQFLAENIACGTYYCCWPRGPFLNRLMDTPLAKIRMNGWLFYRFQPKLFLHWGYNYWYQAKTRNMIDPYTVGDGKFWPMWPYGDTFCVYPGAKGPVDSIRWEVFAESMQDYALLQTVHADPNGPLLAECLDFEHFPKNAAWILKARAAVLRGSAAGKNSLASAKP
jgi:hypothetical protein